MTNLAEKLVKRYFELYGYFVRTNIRFKTEKNLNSDIDLAIIHRRIKDKAIVSVKGWNRTLTTYYFTKPKRRRGLLNFISDEGIKKAKRVLKTDENKFRKILIAQRLSKTNKARNKVLQHLKKEGLDFISFDVIIEKIINHVKEIPDYPESEIYELIRFLKIHNRIK